MFSMLRREERGVEKNASKERAQLSTTQFTDMPNKYHLHPPPRRRRSQFAFLLHLITLFLTLASTTLPPTQATPSAWPLLPFSDHHYAVPPSTVREYDFTSLFRENLITDHTFTFLEQDDKSYEGDILQYLIVPDYITTTNCDNIDKANDITIFTQCSINRLDLIFGIIESGWKGCLSVALYIDDPKQLPTLTTTLNNLETKLESSSSSCTKISLLFGQAFTASTTLIHHPYDFFYPINALRNLALSRTETRWVVSMDVDFVPSEGLYDTLKSAKLMDFMEERTKLAAVKEEDENGQEIGSEYTKIDQCGGAVFIIPAFEHLDKSQSLQLPITRKTLHKGCVKGTIIPFHSKLIKTDLDTTQTEQFCLGKISKYHISITNIHKLTNFTKWFSTTSDSNNNNLPYQITVLKNYIDRYFEPYWIADKRFLPAFDERFRGYAFNKRSHNIELQYRNTEFWVIPDVFVLHRWHGQSDSKKKLGGMIRATVGRAYNRFQGDMRKVYGEGAGSGKKMRSKGKSGAGKMGRKGTSRHGNHFHRVVEEEKEVEGEKIVEREELEEEEEHDHELGQDVGTGGNEEKIESMGSRESLRDPEESMNANDLEEKREFRSEQIS